MTAAWNVYLQVWCFKKSFLNTLLFCVTQNSRLTKSKIKSLINFKFSFTMFVVALFEIKKEKIEIYRSLSAIFTSEAKK